MTGGPGSTMPPVNDPVYSPANVVAFAFSDFVPQTKPINANPRSAVLIWSKLKRLSMAGSFLCVRSWGCFRSTPKQMAISVFDLGKKQGENSDRSPLVSTNSVDLATRGT